jgi:hypothetical protein
MLNSIQDDIYLSEKSECDKILFQLNQKMLEEEKLKKKNSHFHNHKTIINNIEKEEEMHSSKVNFILNKYTKQFVNSTLPSDIIQSSLEFNKHLIENFLENSNKLSQSENEYCLNILWKNLKKLSKCADQHVKSANLSKNDKYSQIYTRLKEKEKLRKENLAHSGLTITVNKSILEEFPEK